MSARFRRELQKKSKKQCQRKNYTEKSRDIHTAQSPIRLFNHPATASRTHGRKKKDSNSDILLFSMRSRR